MWPEAGERSPDPAGGPLVMTVGQLPARSSRVMVTIERRSPPRHWGVPGRVGEGPLLGGVGRPPLPAGTLPGPPLSRPLQAGGGGGGAGRDGGPAGGVGVLVVVGVGTSGRAA